MTKVLASQRFLAIYSGVLTAAFAITVFCAFSAPEKTANFDQITVHRLDIVEPDGTLRMVISDKADFPGLIVKNKEAYAHKDRSTAGMIFFNDEGTENGGLIFGGMKDKDGKMSSYGHLSFDRYLQDQVFTIQASEEGTHKAAGLNIDDRPDWPITDMLSLPQSEWQKFITSHPQAHQRIHLGSNDDRSASLVLKDPDGHPRIVIQVAADGSPALEFLDVNGKVVSQLPNVGSDGVNKK
jgi:hypothetical protein